MNWSRRTPGSRSSWPKTTWISKPSSGLQGKALAPQVRSDAAQKMITICQLSERRAGHLAGLSRDTYRHPPVMGESDQVLPDAIVSMARQRRRFGY